MSHIQLSEISVVVPVKDNSIGVHQLLHSFFNTQKPDQFPKEIIIVDNLSEPEIILDKQLLNKGISIRLIKCDKKGPAAARNKGVKVAEGSWIFFTDSDCIFTETSLSGYLTSVKGGIAYAGNITPLKNNILSKYYQQINLLNPPEKLNHQPAFIVTASCLINKSYFDSIGGFNETFVLASGEDVDLGLRLSKIGTLYFASQSIVKHNFENSLIDFYKRFYRYGQAISLLEKNHTITINLDQVLPKTKFGFYFLLTELLKVAFKKGKNNSLN